jgi:hypothetical protein
VGKPLDQSSIPLERGKQMQMTSMDERKRNTARRLLSEGSTQQIAVDYLVGFYGITENEAQVVVCDVSHPGGFEAWMLPPK